MKDDKDSDVSEIISVIEPTEPEVTTTVTTDKSTEPEVTTTVATDKSIYQKAQFHRDLKVLLLTAVVFAFLLFLVYLAIAFI